MVHRVRRANVVYQPPEGGVLSITASRFFLVADMMNVMSMKEACALTALLIRLLAPEAVQGDLQRWKERIRAYDSEKKNIFAIRRGD